MLCAPHGNPLKSYMPLLREYVLEVACIIPQAEVRTLFVIPSRDALSQQALDCSKTVQGAIPEDFVRSSRLSDLSGIPLRLASADPRARGFAQKAMPAVAPNQLRREVAEAWAGVALLVGEMIRLGFTGRAYECVPAGKDT